MIETCPVAPRSWQFIETPPMSGEANMAMDAKSLDRMDLIDSSPVLRFFRWSRPTLSYGRLQQRTSIEALIPQGWDAVQRPTGGGVVSHDQDLCFSLAWKAGEAPLPSSLKEIYPWIHSIVQEALAPWIDLHLATCGDCATPKSSFQERQCFEAPVAYDLLDGNEKIVGGAIARRRQAFLYQGTIHRSLGTAEVLALADSFKRRLQI